MGYQSAPQHTARCRQEFACLPTESFNRGISHNRDNLTIAAIIGSLGGKDREKNLGRRHQRAWRASKQLFCAM